MNSLNLSWHFALILCLVDVEVKRIIFRLLHHFSPLLLLCLSLKNTQAKLIQPRSSSHTTPVHPSPFKNCSQVKSNNPSSPHHFKLALDSLQYQRQDSLPHLAMCLVLFSTKLSQLLQKYSCLNSSCASALL